MPLLPLRQFEPGDLVWSSTLGGDIVGVVTEYRGFDVYFVEWGNSDINRLFHACYLRRTIVQELIDELRSGRMDEVALV